jgi:hypothetical protein
MHMRGIPHQELGEAGSGAVLHAHRIADGRGQPQCEDWYKTIETVLDERAKVVQEIEDWLLSKRAKLFGRKSVPISIRIKKNKKPWRVSPPRVPFAIRLEQINQAGIPPLLRLRRQKFSPNRPPQAAISPGSPAPTIGPGTAV